MSSKINTEAQFALIADTSANSLSVVLAKWDDVRLSLIDSYSQDNPQKANQLLITTISSLCEKHSIQPPQISYFAITTGPGSFTGTRIGVITFKTLTYIGQILNPTAKLLALSSHMALVYSAKSRGLCGPYTSAINALRHQTFNAQFELHADRVESLSPLDGPALDNDKANLDYLQDNITVEGLCAYVQAELLNAESDTSPSVFTSPFSLLPTYTRLSDAEENEICAGQAYDGSKLPIKIVANKPKITSSSMQYIALNAPSHENSYILAIETSCDETAVCIMGEDGVILSSIVSSSVPWHKRFGGVVPEIASRKHLEFLLPTLDTALKQAQSVQPNFSIQQICAVAVTSQPGLIGALVLGVAAAKSIAWMLNVPLIAVNHLVAHLYARWIVPTTQVETVKTTEAKHPSSPMVGSIISGGHTLLVYSEDWCNFAILGSTIDDAVGEAFDKVAKTLGLGYPGGPEITQLAKKGDKAVIDFPRSLLSSHEYNFSLSGLKTAVANYIKQLTPVELEQQRADICASFQSAVIDVQVKKALEACVDKRVSTFIAGGGVIINEELQCAYEKTMEPHGIRCYFPSPELTGDNAAMIAAVGLEKYLAGEFSDLTLDASGQAVRMPASGDVKSSKPQPQIKR